MTSPKKPLPEPAAGGLLTIEEVSAVVRLRKTAIYARVDEGTFPPPIRLSKRCSRWKASDVRDWVDSLSAVRA